ncbi:reverse transcriptase domain-containing protein [Tanacetum coccineum]
MIRGNTNKKRPREQSEQWTSNEISFPSMTGCQLVNSPIILEVLIEGFQVRRIYVDGGSSSEVMYEHCFRNLRAETKEKLKESRTPLVGFSGEPPPYNVILGRTGLRSLGAVASTIHSMINFPTANGIATMTTKRETLQECRRMEEAQGPAMEIRTIPPRMQASKSVGTISKGKEGSRGYTDKIGEPDVIIQPSPISSKKYTQTDEKGKGEDGSLEKSPGSKPPEKVVIHDGYPDQTITIGGSLTAEYRSRLIEMLCKHADAFAWTPADMTGIPCFVAEHELKTYPHIEPRVQRKRSIAPDIRKVVKDEPDNSWRMCVDFKDLNKACPKDQSPLPEIDWKIESLMEFKYKCFLDAYKGYHQIQMAKKDEEKTAFHTDEGVFSYTKMPFGLINLRATYQRLVDTIFEGQMGRNLEAYVDDMVIKSKTELEMIKDVEETLLTLKKAEEAFQAMKKLIAKLPTLTAPKKEEERISGQRSSLCRSTSRKRWKTNPDPLHTMTEDNPTQVKTDGSDDTLVERETSNRHGSGAGLILIDPKGAEYSYALRLNFSNSNNDAEYEALLAGLRIATKMKVEKNACICGFEIGSKPGGGVVRSKRGKTKKYKEKTLEMIRSFSNFQISYIPREENRKADALSKLAAMQCEVLTKGILIKLNERSVDMIEVNTIIEESTRT